VVPRKRAQFVLARAALRRVLGRVLGVPPRTVALEVGAEGKPWHPEVAFNLSHSERLACIAVAPAGAVAGGPPGEGALLGVDVERFKPPEFPATRLEGMARRVLHPAELQAWLELDPPARREAFVRTWVRKEAVLKALGTGFTLPAAGLELAAEGAADGAPFRVHAAHPWGAGAGAGGSNSWQLHDGDDVELEERYGVAVCWGGAALQLRTFAWPAA
jgi:4'-phosphopantetheinyl transferase